MQTLTYVDFKYCLMLPGVSVTNKCQIPYPELSAVLLLPCPGPRTPAEYCAQCDCRHWVTLTLALPGYISHTVSKYSIAFSLASTICHGENVHVDLFGEILI